MEKSVWQSCSRFVNHLHREGKYGFWCYESVERRERDDRPLERESIWWRSYKPAQFPAHKGEHGFRNVWFGVNPTYEIPDTSRRGDPMHEKHLRSQEHLISAVNCLFAEFDGKDFGGKKATSDHILSLQMNPSVVIDSGGGYHCYWLLKEPWILKNRASRLEAREVQYDWVDHVLGDQVSKNLNRVLRVPGYRNYKPEYAPNYPLVSFVRFKMGWQYSLNELRAILPKKERKADNPEKMGAEDLAVWMLLGDSMSGFGQAKEVAHDVAKRSVAYKTAELQRRWHGARKKR